MMNGPGRSGRGGRGGGRLGPRTFQNRDKGGFPRSIETWNNPGADENTGESLKMGKLNYFCIAHCIAQKLVMSLYIIFFLISLLIASVEVGHSGLLGLGYMCL